MFFFFLKQLTNQEKCLYKSKNLQGKEIQHLLNEENNQIRILNFWVSLFFFLLHMK